MKNALVSGIKAGFMHSAKGIDGLFAGLFGKRLSDLWNSHVVKPIKSFFGFIWKKATGLAGKSVRSIVRRVRNKSDALRAKHEASGDADYDDERRQGYYDEKR